jgi:hypothetical protein
LNGQTVTTPNGEAWTVRRCWMAKRQLRWRGRNPLGRRPPKGRQSRSRDKGDRTDWLHTVDVIDADNPLAALLAVAVVIVIAVLGWFFLVPLLLAILDLTILILLTLGGLATRTLLRRPWEIEALAPDGRRLTWQVVGWQRSRRAITAVTRVLHQGQIPPTDSPHFPPP